MLETPLQISRITVNALSSTIAAALLLFSLPASTPADAACTCICVNGLNRPLCSSIADRKPVCPPRACPREPSISRPIDRTAEPPAGAKTCNDRYIYNRYSQAYEWRRLCR